MCDEPVHLHFIINLVETIKEFVLGLYCHSVPTADH